MLRLFVSVVISTAVLLVAPAAFATSVVLLDLETHLADSTAVVEAVVGASESSLDSRTGRPVTDVRVDVKDTVYGETPETFRIRQLKGKVGAVEVHFPGAGELVTGSRVLLFVVQAEGHWWLTALAQSVYDVSGEGQGARAVRQLDQLHLFVRDPVLGVVPLEGHKEETTELDALKARVRAEGAAK